MRRSKPRQMWLDEGRWGGWRPGAGRKKSRHSGVSHAKRLPLSRHHPVHVTMRVRSHLPSLRRKMCLRAIVAALRAGKERLGLRIIHYSIQSNHLHLIVDPGFAGTWSPCWVKADDERALGRGLKGLGVRIAKALNRVLGRKGSVFADRFHAHVLKTPTEVRRALAYVLNNWRKHAAERGRRYARALVDLFSSAAAFSGWRTQPRCPEAARRSAFETTIRARCYLLREGWRKLGLIDPGEVPGWLAT